MTTVVKQAHQIHSGIVIYRSWGWLRVKGDAG